ncbi:MAG: sel1 repeat family protein, partial [Bacteroidales bacterium]|nr:sel1 repeat family protein [Bacteroidales bacterium]
MNNNIKKLTTFFFALLVCVSGFGQNLLLKAKSGSADAQYELATQYYKGIGQLQNYNTAFVWYKRAAEKNHLASCYALGQMYEKGLGCTQNERLAFSYYMQAAERGHFDAQLRVAQMFDEGIGVVDNPARAYLWYRICADRDEVYA